MKVQEKPGDRVRRRTLKNDTPLRRLNRLNREIEGCDADHWVSPSYISFLLRQAGLEKYPHVRDAICDRLEHRFRPTKPTSTAPRRMSELERILADKQAPRITPADLAATLRQVKNLPYLRDRIADLLEAKLAPPSHRPAEERDEWEKNMAIASLCSRIHARLKREKARKREPMAFSNEYWRIGSPLNRASEMAVHYALALGCIRDAATIRNLVAKFKFRYFEEPVDLAP